VKVVIMGCGRVGAQLATMLDRDGHHVTVLDVLPEAFRRLPSSFKGVTMVGNGIDADTLVRAGIEQADVFAATTQGDNRNLMASQIARELYKVPKVVCRVYDPIREEFYKSLGLETISPTKVGALLLKALIENKQARIVLE
jgi:trk system potassium uptake protein TrkA